jgi:ABC-type transport system involved in multi-copper enzyme maturation permease subunit
MKEILIYAFIAVSSMVLWSYVVHMMIGGLVSEETEYMVMGIAVTIGIIVISAMAWDVIQRRRGRK